MFRDTNESGCGVGEDASVGMGVDWKRAHEELVRLARAQAALDDEIGRWLLAALRAAAHVHLGYATFAEYAERVFGFDPRATAERLRVAGALERLPSLGRALRDGAVSWSAARELSRVAAPETEDAWLEAARGKTVRQIEQLVSGHRPGDLPSDPPCEDARRYVLRFEVSAETRATLLEAMARARREAGSGLDDDAVLLAMARQLLAGPSDRGRASYQIAVTVCERCERGWQQSKGELVEVDASVVEMASCDAQRIGATHVGAPAARASQDVPPATRRKVMRRDHGRCVVPGCRCATFLDLHHLRPRAEGGGHDPDGLIVLCGAHHRLVHQGALVIEGETAADVAFFHADGTSYGGAVSPMAAETQAEAFRTLRELGYRESEARRALGMVRTHVGRDASVDVVVRRALAVLEVTREEPVRARESG